jgi:hypothetical protein
MDTASSRKQHLYRGTFIKIIGVLGLFLILIVNREFSVADNGDFSRYMGDFAFKPIDMKENWPPLQSEDWNKRFFKGPIQYWSTVNTNDKEPWFTSSLLFWAFGSHINNIFYNKNTLSSRHLGLLFFLIHGFAFIALIACMKQSNFCLYFTLPGSFLLFTDARISAFYNSFYAESIVILAMFVIFAFFVSIFFLDEESRLARGLITTQAVSTSVLLFLAIFAKRQYVYFVFPMLIFSYYIFLRYVKKKNVVSLLIYCGAVFIIICFVVLLSLFNRVGNPDEVHASRVTSYHALYYGILPHSKKQVTMLEQLELPSDSLHLVGKNAWNEKSTKLILETSNINLKTFLKAIYYDPVAFSRLAMSNAKEVGNFDIPLGMVYGIVYAHPPVHISFLSSAASSIAGLIFLFLVLLSSVVVFTCRSNMPHHRFSASRTFTLMMLGIIILDVLVSTFDGQQEARKHVLIASIGGLMVVVQAIYLVISLAFTKVRSSVRAAELRVF